MLRAEHEEALADRTEAARDVLPGHADDAMFAFIIRQLWNEHREESYTEWREALPKRYADFSERHAWLENVEIEGDITNTGIDALADLLVEMRERQRFLEN